MLSLDVGDVDLENRRAVVQSKGGDAELLHFQTASARSLPRQIAERTSGPVFLTDRLPAPGRAPATVDTCRVRGRARLSHRRAEEIFRASGGWTLHEHLARLSPLQHEHVLMLGTFPFTLPNELAAGRRRQLRGGDGSA